jgi:hypothetical protein
MEMKHCITASDMTLYKEECVLFVVGRETQDGCHWMTKV